MTDHASPDHAAPTPAPAPAAPAASVVQEYPKMLFRDAPAHEAEAPPEQIIVGDVTAEAHERKHGFLDAVEYEKARTAAREQAAHEKKAAKTAKP